MKKNTMWLKVASVLSLAQLMNATCEVTAGSCSTSCSDTSCSQSKNTAFWRPFSSDPSLEITQLKSVFQTESHRDEWNGTFSFATKYSQNFGSKCGDCKNPGSMFAWGAAGTNEMTIGNGNGKADIDGWNFGLGNVKVDATTGIGGTIKINPKIMQAGTDFLLYFTQKKDERGLYFKIHAPIGAMSVDPRVTETGTEINTTALTQTTTTTALINSVANVNTGVGITYYTNYFAPDNRSTSLASALAGGIGADNSLNGNRPIYHLSMDYGKLASCKRTQIRLADLAVVLGYNLFANEKGLVGIGFKATCPTGTVPTAEYALEPIFGRGGVWGVGGDIMAHYKVWENDAKTRFCDIWFQGEVLHLLPGRVGHRSFDLKANGKGSKYILLQHFYQDVDRTYKAGSLTQAVNVTTLPVNSKFAVEGNAALMADFHCNNWNLAVGGEFWGRTKESLSINMCEAVERKKENLNNYAVVGRQASSFAVTAGSGVLGGVVGVVPLVQPAAKINTAAANATLLGGTGILPLFPSISPAAVNTPAISSTTIVDGRIAANRIPADLNEALDICGAAAAKAFTGKVFGQFGYTFNDARYTPSISIFGGAEFTGTSNNAVQMWNAGLQGSINF